MEEQGPLRLVTNDKLVEAGTGTMLYTHPNNAPMHSVISDRESVCIAGHRLYSDIQTALHLPNRRALCTQVVSRTVRRLTGSTYRPTSLTWSPLTGVLIDIPSRARFTLQRGT